MRTTRDEELTELRERAVEDAKTIGGLLERVDYYVQRGRRQCFALRANSVQIAELELENARLLRERHDAHDAEVRALTLAIDNAEKDGEIARLRAKCGEV